MARRLPARLTIEQVAMLLQFHADSLDYLISIGMLDVLGGFVPGSQKMFSSAYVVHLCGDVKWLSKATAKVRQHVQKQNAQRREARLARGEHGLEEAA